MSFLTPQPTLTYPGLKLPLKHHHRENSTNLQGPLPTGLPTVLTLSSASLPTTFAKAFSFLQILLLWHMEIVYCFILPMDFRVFVV